MNEQIKQIAERLKGLREVLDLTPEDVASACDIPLDIYLHMEEGTGDLSVSKLQQISRRFEVSLDVLMFGEEPRMDAYFLTRKGTGVSVERKRNYKYQSLAAGFKGRLADPFIVTVEPSDSLRNTTLSIHKGQEFVYIFEGKMELVLRNKVLTLNVGDSIYFDSETPHRMQALDGKKVRFLTVII